MHSEPPKARSALRNEKEFFYRLRGLRSRAHDAPDETLPMKRFRVAAASFIKAAKCVYEIHIQDEIDELSTYSAAWNAL
eukprot:1292182-Pyramimonas_sp.AAC.1